jgi:hypothetical protein
LRDSWTVPLDVRRRIRLSMDWPEDSDSQQAISLRSRRNIVDTLRVQRRGWSGGLSEVDFLSRLWDLDALPSKDYRFRTAAQDIWQHRINNYDWPDDWIFGDTRFNLLRGPDQEFLSFLCEMVHPVVRTDPDEVSELVEMFNQHLLADGWAIVEITELGARPVFAGRRLAEFPTRSSAKVVKESVDSGYVSQQITRMEAAVTSDPELAIGTAKEFVETIAKTILDERGVRVESGVELAKLVRTVARELSLVPESIPAGARARESIRVLLSNLLAIADRMSELRNLYGTGHGKIAEFSGLEPRHARLAVGAATTLGLFLLETHQSKPD